MKTLQYEVDCILRDADRNPVAVFEVETGYRNRFIALTPAQCAAGVEESLSGTRRFASNPITALAYHNLSSMPVGS